MNNRTTKTNEAVADRAELNVVVESSSTSVEGPFVVMGAPVGFDVVGEADGALVLVITVGAGTGAPFGAGTGAPVGAGTGALVGSATGASDGAGTGAPEGGAITGGEFGS